MSIKDKYGVTRLKWASSNNINLQQIKKIRKLLRRIEIIYFLKEYYGECNRNFKLFNYNLIRELSLYVRKF